MATKLDYEAILSELRTFQKSLEAKRCAGIAASQEEEMYLFQLKIKSNAILDAVQAAEREVLERISQIQPEPAPLIDPYLLALRGYSPPPNPGREPSSVKDLIARGDLRQAGNGR